LGFVGFWSGDLKVGGGDVVDRRLKRITVVEFFCLLIILAIALTGALIV
jgi:hypothetical protein